MSTEFRPLSAQELCSLKLRDLNPLDTSWLAFKYNVDTASTNNKGARYIRYGVCVSIAYSCKKVSTSSTSNSVPRSSDTLSKLPTNSPFRYTNRAGRPSFFCRGGRCSAKLEKKELRRKMSCGIMGKGRRRGCEGVRKRTWKVQEVR